MENLDSYLKDTRFFLDGVFDGIQDGIIVLDKHFNIMFSNRWMEEKYASEMPLAGKKCYSVFHNRHDGCPECPYMKVLETGGRYTRILTYPSTENPSEWLEISVFCIEDRAGKVIGAVEHVKDITKAKQAERILQDEVTRRRILIEQSTDGIVILDHNGKVYEANKRYADMLGYSMVEVHGLHVWDWDVQWPKEALLEMVRTVGDAGDRFETRHRRKDGTFYDVEISTNGATYGGQKLIFCVCRDITARKHAEKEREELITELQEALAEIKTLRGILPLCSYCKKIRNDKGYWEQVDVYIDKYSQADISHSVCLECMKRYFPDLAS